MDKQADVLAHVAGPSGSGKTSLLERLRARNPGLLAQDLDLFDEEAKKDLGLEPVWWKGRPDAEVDSTLARLLRLRQQKLDAFLAANRDNPVVLGGHHWEGDQVMRLPEGARRLMLDTGALRSAWRGYRRSQKEGPPYRRTLRELVFRDWPEARQDRRRLKDMGYEEASPAAIERDIEAGLNKQADLLPGVTLQSHQRRIAEEAAQHPIRKLLYWGLGSGKSLGSLAALEAAGLPATVLAPASLRENYRGERRKFTDESLPTDLLSYSQLARGAPVRNTDSLVLEEAHRLRNPGTAASQRALELAQKARNVLILSGTPNVNRAGDLAVPLAALTGKRMSPEEFEQRYVTTRQVRPGVLGRLLGVTPGEEPAVNREKELRSLLEGKVDYYQPERPVVPTAYEDHEVDMSPPQARLYRAMWDRLPWVLRYKLRHDFPLSSQELRRMRSFLTGPRQVGLSTYPYRRDRDALRAFDESPKLQRAFSLLRERLQDPRARALVFANFIDAGLVPYSHALGREGIPHALFSGKLSDRERKQVVDDYNAGKVRVALLGPSGTEGLSFKGTQLVQLLDGSWQPVTPRQAAGRALRYDSHLGLPDELRNVTVQRFVAKLPPGVGERLKATLLWRRARSEPAADSYLRQMEQRKERLNQKFLDLLRSVGSPKESV